LLSRRLQPVPGPGDDKSSANSANAFGNARSTAHSKRVVPRYGTPPAASRGMPGVPAQKLRTEADQPGFFTRTVIEPIRNAFNKVCHRKTVNDNIPALERDNKPKVNWPNIQQKK